MTVKELIEELSLLKDQYATVIFQCSVFESKEVNLVHIQKHEESQEIYAVIS